MGAAYGFNDDHVKAIEEILKSSSERIAAIVGVTILDGTLRKTLEERLRDDKDGANLLFKVNRPLGNTGPKIDLLYMLRAFDKPTKDIRNLFAHNLNIIDSKDDRMVKAFEKLTLHEGRTHYPHHLFPRDRKGDKYIIGSTETKWDKFIVNLQIALLLMMRYRVSFQPHSFRP